MPQMFQKKKFDSLECHFGDFIRQKCAPNVLHIVPSTPVRIFTSNSQYFDCVENKKNAKNQKGSWDPQELKIKLNCYQTICYNQKSGSVMIDLETFSAHFE